MCLVFFCDTKFFVDKLVSLKINIGMTFKFVEQCGDFFYTGKFNPYSNK